MTSISPLTRVQILRAAVLWFWLTECLDLYETTAAEIQKHCGLTLDEVVSRGIKSCPTWVTNLIGAQACASRFGSLSDVPGFYLVNDHWRIHLDPKLSARGFLVPLRDPLRNFITSIKVFRSARDEEPFTLQVRADRMI